MPTKDAKDMFKICQIWSHFYLLTSWFTLDAAVCGSAVDCINAEIGIFYFSVATQLSIAESA